MIMLKLFRKNLHQMNLRIALRWQCKSLTRACTTFSSMMFHGMPSEAAAEITINSPYATVNWETYGQYKANFHAHSVESDGGNQPAEMFEDH